MLLRCRFLYQEPCLLAHRTMPAFSAPLSGLNDGDGGYLNRMQRPVWRFCTSLGQGC